MQIGGTLRPIMLFHSQEFVLGFLPLCLAGFFLLGRVAGPAWALRWLLAASFFFYGWWKPVLVLLLAGSILTNYALACRIRAAAPNPAARRWLTAGIAFNLGLLAWFKYADFLLHTALPQAPALHIFLPLAISFFTFQQIMFLVGSARGECTGCGLLHYASFVAFFPHLIAGPIVRPRDIIPQLAARALAVPRADNLSAGMLLFLIGMAKKLVLGDTFGGFADVGFNAAAHGASLSFVEAWYAVLVLRPADLLRLLRLFRHGDRPGAHAQRGVPRQLRQPVPGTQHRGILAPLAHHPGLVPARLPLHPPRRQPLRTGPAYAQPDGDHAVMRSVAWRGLEFRAVGRIARPVSGAAARLAHKAAAHRRTDVDPARGHRRLGAVPRRGTARRLVRCCAAWRG